ncbi:MAG TPA: aspartate aminotransferase family protein [Oligoflexia bacterium]|nr:aspartate aminotransferase family protein [Oligoflexia bacterium]
MAREFPLVPQDAKKVETRYRRIATAIPVPESVPMLEEMRRCEPRSMSGQPPILWAKGDGVCVIDPWGNRFLDFSSGVLVTGCGHAHPRITAAIQAQAAALYHAYCFPSAPRIELVQKLVSLTPEPLNKVFLLTTGAEATECCIKLGMTWGRRNGGPRKRRVVSFHNSFHGRTMGAQYAGGSAALKEWLDPDPRFVQVPYPDGFRERDISFDRFLSSLAEQSVDAQDVCLVLSETYPGVDVSMWTREYAARMREWCNQHNIVLALDEVQAGFGRTGKWFGFEHLGIVPDLIACGKGIAGGMPLSAVIGRPEVMDLYPPGAMTSTHSANTVCCAAALANIKVIEEEGLVENAARLEAVLRDGASRIAQSAKGRIATANTRGLVAALQFVHSGTTDPDAELAWQVTKRAVESGLMLFAPVGVGGGAIKICPPLIINEEALREGLEVLREIVAELA